MKLPTDAFVIYESGNTLRTMSSLADEAGCKLLNFSYKGIPVYLASNSALTPDIYYFLKENCTPSLNVEKTELGPNQFDPVQKPSHYNKGKIECIDAIEVATDDLKGIEAACTANAIKYLWRWKAKENPVQDLKKAIWYIEHLIKKIENEK